MHIHLVESWFIEIRLTSACNLMSGQVIRYFVPLFSNVGSLNFYPYLPNKPFSLWSFGLLNNLFYS
jgi:hypothetical protein